MPLKVIDMPLLVIDMPLSVIDMPLFTYEKVKVIHNSFKTPKLSTGKIEKLVINIYFGD